LKNSGNVGIGTSIPAVRLHLFDPANSVSHRVESGGGTNAWSRIEFANANGQWNVGASRSYSGDQLYFYRSGASTMAFAIQPSGDATLGGNLNIGSSNTSAKLEARSSSSADGTTAVLGYVATTSAGGSSAGVKGLNDGTGGSGIGVWGEQHGSGFGVYGYCPSGRAVYGLSVGGNGIHGVSTNGWGVHGESTNSYGVHGYSGNSIGAWGEGGGSATGVLGSSTSGTGVRGVGSVGVSAQSNGGLYALHAVAVAGNLLPWAGWFDGNVHISGSMEATGAKNFKIDHPQDPANKYLVHASIESSELLNLYTGNALLDAQGAAVVAVPDWFVALNKDFRYQLTAIGAPGAGLYVANEIAQDHFKIAGGQPGGKVSWQVTGVRQDAWAREHPLVVEQDKPANERGSYLCPAAFGQPEDRKIGRIDNSLPPVPATPPAAATPAPLAKPISISQSEAAPQ